MGANRRSRNNNHHHSHQNTPRQGSDGSDHGRSRKGKSILTGIDEVQANLDFTAALQEVDADSGREITMVVLIIVVPVILSLIVGIAAGMTISIHYFENYNPPLSGTRVNSPYGPRIYANPMGVYKKVTTLDPIIASSNMVQRDGNLDLGTVVTATASGQFNVLMVVDEIAPLHTETQYRDMNAISEQQQQQQHLPQQHLPSVSNPKTKVFNALTSEQAEELAPGYARWEASQPNIELRQPTILPSLCSDGTTFGFDSWSKLRTAVHEANSISAERFLKWNEYFATNSFTAFQDDRLYYEEDIVFSICPGTILRARKGPIFVNAENIVLECDDCVVDVGGTHLAFGANAKNVLVRGVTFRRASTSSLTFFHDGADASFEDCSWVNDSGISNYYGSIAYVNSTSVVNFYQCSIGLGKKRIVMGTTSASTNSLSIRV